MPLLSGVRTTIRKADPMKRQKRKPTAKKSKPAAARAQEPVARRMSRRDLIGNVALGAGALALVGGGGWHLVSDVQAGVQETDLSRIGNGVPAVVQVHDPQCPSCLALQRQTRDAMKAFGPDELQYIVARLDTAEGRRLANRHGVGKVTLLLMDGSGRKRRTMTGESTSAALKAAFRLHLGS